MRTGGRVGARATVARWPADRTLAGRLWNTGWAQAKQDVAAMRVAGPGHAGGLGGRRAGRPTGAVVAAGAGQPGGARGALASYRRAGLRVGFYSTPTMWRGIVGPVRHRFPE